MRLQMIAAPIAVLSLLLAIFAGGFRLMLTHGLLEGRPLGLLYGHHGELMIFAFLAPLIATERYIGSLALPLHRSVHAMPLLVALGAVLKVVSWLTGTAALNVAGTVLAAVGAAIYVYLLFALSRYSSAAPSFYVMALGGTMLLLALLITLYRAPAGNLALTLFMLGFPVFTVLGERVELTRILAPELSRWAMLALALGGASALALLLQVLVWPNTYLLLAAALAQLAIALPLVWGERRLYRGAPGTLRRYLARHLLIGYLWLLLGLAAAAVFALSPAHFLYDAASHSIALGFVFTMILGHGPVILPAFLGRRIEERRLHQVPLTLLTLGNLLRIGGYLLRGAGLYLPAAIAFSWILVLGAVAVFAVMMARAIQPAIRS